jgi:hypothetical protein
MGRARAKARRVGYNPEEHYPHRGRLGIIAESNEPTVSRVEEILEKWMERGNRWARTVDERRHLKVIE